MMIKKKNAIVRAKKAAETRRRNKEQLLLTNTVNAGSPPGSMEVNKLLRTLSTFYSHDPSAPGMILSWLPSQGKFYGAVLRFSMAYGEGKRILHKAYGDSISEVVLELKRQAKEKMEASLKLIDDVRSL